MGEASARLLSKELVLQQLGTPLKLRYEGEAGCVGISARTGSAYSSSCGHALDVRQQSLPNGRVGLSSVEARLTSVGDIQPVRDHDFVSSIQFRRLEYLGS
ncbi:unnamed protein product [Prunus armeniaca]